MSIIRKLVFVSIIMMILINVSYGQMNRNAGMFPNDKKMFGPPIFLYDTFYFKSDEDSLRYKLVVYTAFANDILQFVKERQGNFTARYDLFVSIFDEKGNQVGEGSKGNVITASSFDETNNRNLTNEHKLSYDLIPGEYKLVLNLTDFDTQKSLTREKEIEIKPYGLEQISLSQVLFSERVKIDSSGHIIDIFPNLSRNFLNPGKSFWAYFELYPSILTEDIKLIYTVMNSSEEAIVRQEKMLKAEGKIIPYLLDLNELIKTPGRYTIIIQAAQAEHEANVRAKFSTNWSNFEISQLNINTAIEAMKDYMPSKDYKFLQSASDSEKNVWFENFWKQRDPIPDTQENELLREFYKRIDISNNYFTVNAMDKEGWKTDRGNIYIKYGPPSDVERHVEELNLPPYEIWFYEKLQRRFIFEDRSGLGDFQLVRIE